MNNTLLFVITAGAGLLANIVITPIILVAAHRFRVFDRIDHRKAHSGQIPALGGIGIFLSFTVAGAVAYGLLQLGPLQIYTPWRILAIVIGLVVIHVTGVTDDMLDIPAGRKLALQIGAAVVVVTGGTVFTSIDLPVTGFGVSLGVLAPPITVLWIIGIANAMNLVDGIDGFAGGIALFAAVTMGVIALVEGFLFAAIVSAALAGAVAGFLFFNVPPARIFMGDGGSLFLGFSLAVLAVLVTAIGVPVGVPLVLLMIPALDTLTAILRRTRRNIPIHVPDANHFHHRLVRITGSNRRALAVAWSLNAVTASGAFVYALISGWWGVGALLTAGFVVFTVFVVVFRRCPAEYDHHTPSAT